MDSFNGRRRVDCTGLIRHLEQTKNVYPEVLAGGKEMANWARNIWNRSFDKHAPPVGEWP